MRKQTIAGLACAAVLSLGATTLSPSGVLASAPTAPAALATALPAVPADEHAATISAMKPPKRTRPVIALVGDNDGTETTDYIVPYAVLKASGSAEVVALAMEDRPLKLKPALTLQADATVTQFDARYPDGADYVILPAITDRDNPAVVAWIREQAAKGATIVAICAGTVTASEAGLLADRSATGHWYDIERLRKANPGMRWTPDRRYVADRGVVTTTGVTASLPVSLALVEAIAGRERAAEVAREFGVATWDARHDSSVFKLNGETKRLALINRLAFWKRERYGVPVASGADEVALAFTADAWSRTFRSRAFAIADVAGPIRLRHGLTLLPDRVAGEDAELEMLSAPTSTRPADALPEALASIAERYDDRTAAFVALQLEDSGGRRADARSTPPSFPPSPEPPEFPDEMPDPRDQVAHRLRPGVRPPPQIRGRA